MADLKGQTLENKHNHPTICCYPSNKRMEQKAAITEESFTPMHSRAAEPTLSPSPACREGEAKILTEISNMSEIPDPAISTIHAVVQTGSKLETGQCSRAGAGLSGVALGAKPEPGRTLTGERHRVLRFIPSLPLTPQCAHRPPDTLLQTTDSSPFPPALLIREPARPPPALSPPQHRLSGAGERRPKTPLPFANGRILARPPDRLVRFVDAGRSQTVTGTGRHGACKTPPAARYCRRHPYGPPPANPHWAASARRPTETQQLLAHCPIRPHSPQ